MRLAIPVTFVTYPAGLVDKQELVASADQGTFVLLNEFNQFDLYYITLDEEPKAVRIAGDLGAIFGVTSAMLNDETFESLNQSKPCLCDGCYEDDPVPPGSVSEEFALKMLKTTLAFI
jgi:hypothetical protein